MRLPSIEHVQRAADRVGALDLGQQDGVGAGARHGDEVGMAPGGVETVHPRDQLAPGKGGAVLQRPDDLLPPVALGVGRDGVLEVEDQPVGRQRPALLQRAGVRARHVEDAAARTNTLGHGAHLSTFAAAELSRPGHR